MVVTSPASCNFDRDGPVRNESIVKLSKLLVDVLPRLKAKGMRVRSVLTETLEGNLDLIAAQLGVTERQAQVNVIYATHFV